MIEPMAWAREHFGKVDLGDARRTARLVRMAASAAASPAGTVTEVFQKDAERQGAYDLLESEHVDADALERGVGEILGARCAQEQRVLVVIDGANISLSDFYGKRRLGKIGNYRYDGAGVKVISALALDVSGVPLGLLRQVMWSRPRQRPAKRGWAQTRPLATKETRHWVDAIETSAARVASTDTKLTYIMDREADADSVIRTLVATGHHFVVRCRNRRAQLRSRTATLHEHFAGQPALGEYHLQVTQRDGRAARVA